MSHRNVRLGIVYRGSIVKEELIDRQIDVSVGLRADSTVQFSPKDYPDFPDHLDVLYQEAGQHFLVVPSDPSARINLRGASQADNVKTIRNKRCIPIGDVAGGSVVVGDVTVMFQFVRGYTAPTRTVERTVLRLGLVFDERLISDRIFPHEKTISIGGLKDDTVVLDQSDYSGPSLSFVNNKDGSVLLKAPGDMKLRIAVQDDAPRDVKELIQRGKAKLEGDVTVAHLTLGARGRAVLGPYSVLFQVVRQKVVVPTMEKKSLPQRFIGVFLQDVVWTACFATALLLVGGVVTQAVLYQTTHGKYLKDTKKAEEHVSAIIDVEIVEKEEIKQPEEEPKEEPKETAPEMKPEPKAKPKKKAKPDKKVEKAEKAPKPESTGKTVDPEERKRNARKLVAKKTIAGALLGAGGASSKLFAEGGEGDATVVAKTFGGAGDAAGPGDGPGGGVKLAGGGSGGGTVEKVKTGKSKGFGKRKKIATKRKKKVEKKIKISLSAGALGGSGAGKSGVARVIARKNSAVRRCYESALRKTPGLSGKVKVRFTVGTAGTITSVTVMGASGGFSSCIKKKFQRIRGLPLLPAPQSFTQSYVFTKS